MRDDQRAHRQEDLAADEHRPADVHERLVADEREVADRERGPRVAMAAAADANEPSAPDPGAEEGATAAQLEIGAELRELADRDDLLAHDGRTRPESNAVLDDDARRDDEGSLAELDAVPDLRSRSSRSAATFSAGGSARNASCSSDSRTPARRAPAALVGIERRRQRDALGRHAREHRPRLRARCAFCATISASTSFSVMKPRFSTVERSIPCSSASSTAFRVAFRSPGAGFGAGFSSAFASIDGELVGRLGDVRDRLAQLDLDVVGVELHDRPRAGRLDLDRRLRRLDDADGLPGRHLRAVLDEPLREERVLGVRVLARENDLEHARASFARRRAP